MSDTFDWKKTDNYTQDGNPEIISCHAGMVFVLEQISQRPQTVTLRNIDNLDGDDPDPSLVAFEDLPRTLRRELRRRGIRFRSSVSQSVTAAEVM